MAEDSARFLGAGDGDEVRGALTREQNGKFLPASLLLDDTGSLLTRPSASVPCSSFSTE